MRTLRIEAVGSNLIDVGLRRVYARNRDRWTWVGTGTDLLRCLRRAVWSNQGGARRARHLERGADTAATLVTIR